MIVVPPAATLDWTFLMSFVESTPTAKYAHVPPLGRAIEEAFAKSLVHSPTPDADFAIGDS